MVIQLPPIYFLVISIRYTPNNVENTHTAISNNNNCKYDQSYFHVSNGYLRNKTAETDSWIWQIGYYTHIYLNIARKCIIHLNTYTLHALLSHLIRLLSNSIWNKICFLPYVSTSNKWQLLSKRAHKGSSPCMFWCYGMSFWTFKLYFIWCIC